MVCALSGGVDSSVVATLIHRAIGDRLTCVFVNNGVLRKNEGAGSARSVQGSAAPEPALRGRHRKGFLPRCKGVKDPERKRKIIGTAIHQSLRRGGARPWRRAVSGPGDPLSRRHRKRLVQRAFGDDQEPPQCRRSPQADAAEAHRAAEGAFQGRGARRRT